MELLDPKGRRRVFRFNQYLIDWDHTYGSKTQRFVQDFMRPFWQHDVVLAEALVPGPQRLRLDLYNVSRSIIIEVSPTRTHSAFNPFFHRSLAGYRASIKRDLAKQDFARLNGLTLVEVSDADLPLTKTWFKKQYGITL